MTEYEEELEALFLKLYGKAYRAAKSICFDRQMAEDAVSEAFVRLLHASRKGRIWGGGEQYFMKIAVNEARRINARRKELPSENIAEYLEASGAEKEDREAAQALLEAVNRLGEKFSLPIRLHYYGGFSEKEVAQLLGISYSAVKARMMRGRKRLRVLIEQETAEKGGTCHDEI